MEKGKQNGHVVLADLGHSGIGGDTNRSGA